MKQLRLAPLALLAVLAAMAMGACAAQDRYSGTLITGGEHRVGAGTTLETVTLQTGGRLIIEPDGQLQGAVLLLGGELDIEGTLQGDLSALAGTVEFGPKARVTGDVISADAQLHGAGDAVAGEFIQGSPIGRSAAAPQPWWRQGLGLLFQVLGRGAAAFLLLRWLPRPLTRTGQALRRYPHIAAAVGVLAGVVILVLLVQMAFTVVLIPVSLGLGVLFIIVLWLTSMVYGAALTDLTRRALGNPQLSLAAAGAIATVAFALAFELIGRLPLAGAILQLLLIAMGLGAWILTRFGQRTFVAQTDRDLL